MATRYPAPNTTLTWGNNGQPRRGTPRGCPQHERGTRYGRGIRKSGNREGCPYGILSGRINRYVSIFVWRGPETTTTNASSAHYGNAIIGNTSSAMNPNCTASANISATTRCNGNTIPCTQHNVNVGEQWRAGSYRYPSKKIVRLFHDQHLLSCHDCPLFSDYQKPEDQILKKRDWGEQLENQCS